MLCTLNHEKKARHVLRNPIPLISLTCFSFAHSCGGWNLSAELLQCGGQGPGKAAWQGCARPSPLPLSPASPQGSRGEGYKTKQCEAHRRWMKRNRVWILITTTSPLHPLQTFLIFSLHFSSKFYFSTPLFSFHNKHQFLKEKRAHNPCYFVLGSVRKRLIFREDE